MDACVATKRFLRIITHHTSDVDFNEFDNY